MLTAHRRARHADRHVSHASHARGLDLPVRRPALIPAPVRSATSALTLATLLFAGGCGDEDRELREWRAEDHVQPAQPAPDQTTGEVEEPPPEVVARAAAALYGARCASCHGVEGRGDGPEAPGGGDMPDFSSAQYHDTRSDEDLARAITMGSGLMPAFGSQINQRGVAALVDHVRTLGQAPSP